MTKPLYIARTPVGAYSLLFFFLSQNLTGSRFRRRFCAREARLLGEAGLLWRFCAQKPGFWEKPGFSGDFAPEKPGFWEKPGFSDDLRPEARLLGEAGLLWRFCAQKPGFWEKPGFSDDFAPRSPASGRSRASLAILRPRSPASGRSRASLAILRPEARLLGEAGLLWRFCAQKPGFWEKPGFSDGGFWHSYGLSVQETILLGDSSQMARSVRIARS